LLFLKLFLIGERQDMLPGACVSIFVFAGDLACGSVCSFCSGYCRDAYGLPLMGLAALAAGATARAFTLLASASSSFLSPGSRRRPRVAGPGPGPLGQVRQALCLIHVFWVLGGVLVWLSLAQAQMGK
jgi:hypothetical protein